MIRGLLRRARLPLMFVIGMAAALTMAPRLPGGDVQSGPWSKAELMEPASLAKLLKSSTAQPNIICVGFPVLYRQRHILHARFAGPANNPEGLTALREVVQTLRKDSEIVIYCGCCPIERCPNVRPAYQLLKELGFSRIRVLDLPTNFHTDWSAKGYPVE